MNPEDQQGMDSDLQECIDEIHRLQTRITELEAENIRLNELCYEYGDDIVMLAHAMDCKCTEAGHDNRLFAVMKRKHEEVLALNAELLAALKDLEGGTRISQSEHYLDMRIDKDDLRAAQKAIAKAEVSDE